MGFVNVASVRHMTEIIVLSHGHFSDICAPTRIRDQWFASPMYLQELPRKFPTQDTCKGTHALIAQGTLPTMISRFLFLSFLSHCNSRSFVGHCPNAVRENGNAPTFQCPPNIHLVSGGILTRTWKEAPIMDCWDMKNNNDEGRRKLCIRHRARQLSWTRADPTLCDPTMSVWWLGAHWLDPGAPFGSNGSNCSRVTVACLLWSEAEKKGLLGHKDICNLTWCFRHFFLFELMAT